MNGGRVELRSSANRLKNRSESSRQKNLYSIVNSLIAICLKHIVAKRRHSRQTWILRRLHERPARSAAYIDLAQEQL